MKCKIGFFAVVFSLVIISGCSTKSNNVSTSPSQAGQVSQASIDKAGHFKALADQHKNQADTQYQAAINLYQCKELDQAAEYYQKAIKLDNKNPLYHNNLGNVFRDMKEYDQAADEYLKAVRLDPHFIVSYTNLAQMREAIQKDRQGALNILEQGLRNNPHNGQLLGAKSAYEKQSE